MYGESGLLNSSFLCTNYHTNFSLRYQLHGGTWRHPDITTAFSYTYDLYPVRVFPAIKLAFSILLLLSELFMPNFEQLNETVWVPIKIKFVLMGW